MFQLASRMVPAVEVLGVGLGVPVQAVANRARAARRNEGFIAPVEHGLFQNDYGGEQSPAGHRLWFLPDVCQGKLKMLFAGKLAGVQTSITVSIG